jgi:hypothetical protein
MGEDERMSEGIERPTTFQTQEEYDDWHDAHVCVNCGTAFPTLTEGGYCTDCRPAYFPEKEARQC